MVGANGPYDLLPDPVLRVDRRSGRVLDANVAARELLGFDPTGDVGRLADRLELAGRTSALVSAALLDQGPQRLDICVLAPGGKRCIDVVARAESAEVAIVVGRDVTAARTHATELENIVNTVADPIFAKNERFEWTVLNDATCDFIGQSRAALLGRTDYDVFPEAEADEFREKDQLVFDHHLETPHLNVESFTDSAGKKHTIATKKRAFINADGSKTLVGVIRDISELVQLQHEKDAFLANVSHELRTPLTLTLAPLESVLAGDFGPLSDRLRATCETMHNNAVRLLQMVTSLLDLSKLEAGALMAHREPVEVVALTRTAVHDFDPLAARKGLTLNVVARTDAPVVSLDRYLFDRIVFNLLSNAVKFTPEGGRIDVTLEVRDGALTLRVRDTGIGIPTTDRPRLFEKFRQVEGTTTRRHEGTGLGLALVKEFTELLDGEVTVVSDVGVGSTFTVCITAPPTEAPIVPQDREPLVERYAHESLEFLHDEKSERPRVLVVEDNAELATYIGRLLEERCQLKLAADGDEGWQLANDWHPDLVLSDVMMPGRDGFTLCRDLKAGRKTQDIPVVLLTALTHRDALLRGWEAGADEYLFKPFHPRELTTRVGSLLDNLAMRRQAQAEALEKAKALTRAETMLEQVEMFAYVASHHLQEPLRKVLLFGDLLETEAAERLGAEPLDHLHRLEAAAQKMSRYIQDLRDFASVTTRDAPFDDVDLSLLLGEVVESLDAPDARIEVGKLPTVRGDLGQLRQLFEHLIVNALRHPGDAPLVVQVRCASLDAEFAEIEVCDNGIGFEPKYAERIFRPFERLEADTHEGSGMGLATCRIIALRHHGQIAASAEPGNGATFRVTLPVR